MALKGLTTVNPGGVLSMGPPPKADPAQAGSAVTQAGAPSVASMSGTGVTQGGLANLDSTALSGLYTIGNALSGALGGSTFGAGSLLPSFLTSSPLFTGAPSVLAGAAAGGGVATSGALAATAGLSVFPAFAAMPAMFALQGLMSYLGPSKARASITFGVKDGVVYANEGSTTSGAPSLQGWGDALAAYANAQFQGNAPANWSPPSLSTGHKGLDSPSFAAPAIFQQGGRESSAAGAYHKGSAPIRYYPGETQFEEFAGAWAGNQDQRLSLASGMNAIGMNLNTNYIADPDLFTEVARTGQDSGGAIDLFTPEQMRVRDIGRA